jgi:integrase
MAGKLTARKVETARPGRHGDGGGLILRVLPSGARQWVLRIVVAGRRRDIGLGGYPVVPLADAREQALAIRRMVRKGLDPVPERRKASVPTFKAAALEVHAEHLPTWKNPKHGRQWLTTLEQFVFPHIGDRLVNAIDGPAVRGVLGPIWLTVPETARRVRQRIGAVLDYAASKGFRPGLDNPVKAIAKGLPRQPKERGHFAAMPYADVPRFIERLRASGAGEPARLALEWLILTASRTGEALNARWPEIDAKAGTWAIPPERMKAKRLHVVPLPARCLEILRRAKELHSGQGDFIFESRPGHAFSNGVFLQLLGRMGERGRVTAHGFRSCFKDWASETTSFPTDASEAALGHVIRDKVVRAYQRGDLLEKRRELMAAWARHCTETRGKVVELKRGRR